MSKKSIPYMTNEELNEAVAYEVMKWKEGKGLAGGGCRPADAKPTPKIPIYEKNGTTKKLYGGCEMGSRGGTFPYVYYGTLFREKGGCGEFWKPTERLEQAMEALLQMKVEYTIHCCDGVFTVLIGKSSVKSRKLALSICKATLMHVRDRKKK